MFFRGGPAWRGSYLGAAVVSLSIAGASQDKRRHRDLDHLRYCLVDGAGRISR